MSERKELFDDWATHYDESLQETSGFPFEGYDEVLAEVVRRVVGGAGVEAGAEVLDIGTGTGALAARFTALGSRVLGVDFSEHMLSRARQNVPAADFRQLDLLGDWSDLGTRRFDAVVSAYVFHEFDAETKHELLTRFTDVLKPVGCVVVGDISFETAASRDAAYGQWRSVWDESEHYWVGEETLPVLEQTGLRVGYRQLSFCGGIYVVTKAV